MGRKSEAIRPAWPPAPLNLWRLPDALHRPREVLDVTNEPRPLQRFLPDALREHPNDELPLRAAIGSIFVAALERARHGDLLVDQHQPFGEIAVHPSARHLSPKTAA